VPEAPLEAPTTLADLGKTGLAAALRPLFEDAGPLVDYLVGQSFASWDEVIAAAAGAIDAMDDVERANLLAAHPRIGAEPRELALRSRASWAEQGGDRGATDDVTARLAELNDRYEETFGFPFVEWVAGRPRAALVPVLEARLARSRQTELAAGCAALLAIAVDRLARLRSAVT
jgi:2-oxo-4-hydroxy-4-carboxy--5-ureidoimidazoline (OHCU) decarboxylase